MFRILLSFLFGFFSFFAWFLGAAFFEVPGKNSIQENAAGAVALILYLVLGQILLPRNRDAAPGEDWRVRACMAAPLLVFAFLMLAIERHTPYLSVISMLSGGCVGVLLGGLLARIFTRSKQADSKAAVTSSQIF